MHNNFSILSVTFEKNLKFSKLFLQITIGSKSKFHIYSSSDKKRKRKNQNP